MSKSTEGAAADRVREIVERLAESEGLELVLVEMGRAGGRATLRLTIDKEGGVTLDACAAFSRRVGATLEAEDPIPGAYNLEVSSPGLDRRLVKGTDYERFAGQEAKIVMASPVEGRRNFHGIVRGLESGEVLLEIEGGKLVRLPFAAIDKARLVPKF